MTIPALVLDFGGPVLLTPFELVADDPETPAHVLLHERGPLATEAHPDPAWGDLQAGRITERAYWDSRAAEWHAAGGNGPDIRTLVATLYDPPRPELVREPARTLVRDAHAAGHQVAILTNDLLLFHSQEWVDRIEVVGDVDVLVDGSTEGLFKPEPRIYEVTAERLGVAPADMIFLDDQRTNIAGAEALGIPSVWFDVLDPAHSFAEVRKRMGLHAEEDGDG